MEYRLIDNVFELTTVSTIDIDVGSIFNTIKPDLNDDINFDFDLARLKMYLYYLYRLSLTMTY